MLWWIYEKGEEGRELQETGDDWWCLRYDNFQEVCSHVV